MEGDIKTLSGLHGFRLRIGDYRILFDIKDSVIVVSEIIPRGEAYKRRSSK
jgi:mRNA interferase RelE/StbE